MVVCVCVSDSTLTTHGMEFARALASFLELDDTGFAGNSHIGLCQYCSAVCVTMIF